MNEPDGLLLLPRLRIQNANAISGPLSWGFPSPTAFLGFAHALERRLGQDWDMHISGVAIICHHFTPLVAEPASRRYKVFSLSRNPIRAGYKKFEDKDAALVEEGRAHMEVSLLLEIVTDIDDEPEDFLQAVQEAVHGMRLAGGSLLPGYGSAQQPIWQPWWDDEEDNCRAFRRLRGRLLPGFALVQRQDLLDEKLDSLRQNDHRATALDALLDLCALHVVPEIDDKGDVHWRYQRAPGWLTPLPIGYSALSELYEPGEVDNARDSATPFRFVESLYSLGQWVSPHRVRLADALMWRYQTDLDNAMYLTTNDYVGTSIE